MLYLRFKNRFSTSTLTLLATSAHLVYQEQPSINLNDNQNASPTVSLLFLISMTSADPTLRPYAQTMAVPLFTISDFSLHNRPLNYRFDTQNPAAQLQLSALEQLEAKASLLSTNAGNFR